MKKIISVMLVCLMLVCVFTMAVAAESDPTNYAEYGQQTLYALKNGNIPSIDGIITDGEYENVFTFDANTKGVSYGTDGFSAYPEYIKVFISMDDENIYVGFEVKEPYYQYRVEGGASGTFMAFSLGFNTDPGFYHSMNRQTLTLNLYESGAAFKANTVMTYSSDGKYESSYHSEIYDSVAGFRDNTAGITVYEAKIIKKEVATLAGLESLGDTMYIHFLNKSFDSNGNSAEMRYRCILDELSKAVIMAEDGWCASFVPHLLKFVNEIPADTTPADTTTAAPVDTTTPAPVDTTTPAPVDTTTAAPVDTTTAAPADTTTATPADSTTEAPKKGGCGSAVTTLLPLLLVAVVPIIRKKH